ncbi:hypothetical protein Tco_0965554 [Tanacetum coccineum]
MIEGCCEDWKLQGPGVTQRDWGVGRGAGHGWSDHQASGGGRSYYDVPTIMPRTWGTCEGNAWRTFATGVCPEGDYCCGAAGRIPAIGECVCRLRILYGKICYGGGVRLEVGDLPYWWEDLSNTTRAVRHLVGVRLDLCLYRRGKGVMRGGSLDRAMSTGDTTFKKDLKERCSERFPRANLGSKSHVNGGVILGMPTITLSACPIADFGIVLKGGMGLSGLCGGWTGGLGNGGGGGVRWSGTAVMSALRLWALPREAVIL